ncbi:MAG: S8 family serine peptidase [Sandaracinaceae bacterium]
MLACLEASPATACVPVERAVQPPRSLLNFEAGASLDRRPCPSGSVFIEVPVQVPTDTVMAIPADLPADLSASLTTAARGRQGAWFCGRRDAPCLQRAAGAQVEVEPLLRPVTQEECATLPRAVALLRADGSRRCYRVRFTEGGRPIALRNEGLCDLMTTVRTAFIADSGLNEATPVHIGRECDATALQTEGLAYAASEAQLDWHLRRIDAPGFTRQTAPPSSGSLTELALVDSGVPDGHGAGPDIAGQIGVTVGQDCSVEYPLHPHGGGMALLARQVAPEAEIRSIQVLRGQGYGTSGAVARGLDEALFPSSGRPVPADAPLVINLSLGFPSLLGVDASLGDCEAVESPVGASIQYLLYLAALLDEDPGGRRVFVASAAGNQPAPRSEHLFALAGRASALPRSNCSPPRPAWDGRAWFFPAWWNRLETCGPGEAVGRPLGMAVGAVDSADRPFALSIRGVEPPVVAPGQHVFASHPDLRQGVDLCAAPPGQGPNGPEYAPPLGILPRSYSGTSAATILVAAAAARLQRARMNRGQAPLTARALERLIYLTGDLIERRSPVAGVDVRRLNVGKLLGSLDCPSMVDHCAVEVAGQPDDRSTPAITPQVMTDSCPARLEVCFAGYSAPSVDSPRWPAAYRQQLGCCGPIQNATGAAQSCPLRADPPQPGSPCDPAVKGCWKPDTLLGGLGPSPGGVACPDCLILIGGSQAEVYGELSVDFHPATQFSAPKLWLVDEHGADLQVDLAPGQTVVLSPGETIQFEVSQIPQPPEFGEVHSAVLVLDVHPEGYPSSGVVQNFSALYVEQAQGN